uniref:Eph LBD domain-containing protein n=1 Tax=Laticauda laticaudata TaxID=8630 RepID=A0A8C5RL08_LATLA
MPTATLQCFFENLSSMSSIFSPSDMQWSEGQQMINGTPVYMYQDCSVLSEGDTDHWLRTNWIFRGEASSRIFVELQFTIRDCKSFRGEMVSCKETFNLYYMESEQDVGIQFRRPLFTKVSFICLFIYFMCTQPDFQ